MSKEIKAKRRELKAYNLEVFDVNGTTIVSSARSGGKTVRLLMQSERTKTPIICGSIQEELRLKEVARDLGIEAIFQTNVKGAREVIIDDIDLVAKKALGLPEWVAVKGFSFSVPKYEVVQEQEGSLDEGFGEVFKPKSFFQL